MMTLFRKNSFRVHDFICLRLLWRANEGDSLAICLLLFDRLDLMFMHSLSCCSYAGRFLELLVGLWVTVGTAAHLFLLVLLCCYCDFVAIVLCFCFPLLVWVLMSPFVATDVSCCPFVLILILEKLWCNLIMSITMFWNNV